MSSKLISTLRSIANKPNASAATKLITARRICRALVRRIDSINSECRAIYREAAKLELARQRRPKLKAALRNANSQNVARNPFKPWVVAPE